MNLRERTTLPVTDLSADSGCSCCARQRNAPSNSNPTLKESSVSTTQTFPVTGLTCGHCVSAVTDEVRALPGVTDVAVDLTADGVSTLRVTADPQLSEAQVSAALSEAGDYQLAGN